MTLLRFLKSFSRRHALASLVIGAVMISHALSGMRASLSGFILLLQPSLAFVWDVLLFQRPTSLLNWIGVALTLAAIYMGTLLRTPAESARRRSGQ